MKIVEGSLVQIDFGIEYNKIKADCAVGVIYQGMKGIVRNVDRKSPTVVLNPECKEKIIKYNLQNFSSWRTEPMIPFRFLFLSKNSSVLKNE